MLVGQRLFWDTDVVQLGAALVLVASCGFSGAGVVRDLGWGVSRARKGKGAAGAGAGAGEADEAAMKAVGLGGEEALEEGEDGVAWWHPSRWLASHMTTWRCLAVLGLCLGWAWLVDGPLHPIPRRPRTYDRDAFGIVLVAMTAVAIGTWARVPARRPAALPVADDAAAVAAVAHDPGFLCRHVSEEWKGWMQIVFLMYHYFGAKEVYNVIRVLIASYVWLTGYGNACYFVSTKDFSLTRVVRMMFRLNSLCLWLLAVFPGNTFMLYYICPLHCFWFLFTYTVMAVFPSWNKHRPFILLKVGCAMLITFIVWDVRGVFGVVWAPLAPFLRFPGEHDLHEWHFRSHLDHFIPLLGMVVALYRKDIENLLKANGGSSIGERVFQVVLGGMCVVIFNTWATHVLFSGKFDYNSMHPYTSFAPIVAFLVLRNLLPLFRSHYSRFLAWCGRVTLETYLFQFHLLLGDNARLNTTLLPGYNLLNLVVTGSIYVGISYAAFEATATMGAALLPRGQSGRVTLRRLACAAGATVCALVAALACRLLLAELPVAWGAAISLSAAFAAAFAVSWQVHTAKVK